MATTGYRLPKNSGALAEMLRKHVAREGSRSVIARLKWEIYELYIAGFRRFEAINWRTGTFNPFWLADDGKLEPQTAEILLEANRVIGMLSGMDLRPAVNRASDSLDDIRHAATARVIAAATLTEKQLIQMRSALLDNLVMLGCGGLHCVEETMPDGSAGYDVEVVHPRELLPFPSVGYDKNKAQGKVRVRWVSLDYLVDKFGSSIKKRVSKMYAREVAIGSSMDGRMWDDTVLLRSYREPMRDGSSPEPTMEVMVRLNELWTEGVAGTVCEYALTSGDEVLDRVDYESLPRPYYCPLTVVRFLQSSSWYGAGYVDVLFSEVREFERLLKDVINNVRDLDRYPVTVLPHGQINERKQFKDDNRTLRFITVKPELTLMGGGTSLTRPMTISPHNAGADLPGKTAQFFMSMMDRHKMIPDLLEEKGRVDSAQGLKFLDNVSKETMTVPTRNIVEGVGDVYRYMTSEAVTRIVNAADARVPVSGIDLGLAGAVIDFRRGELVTSNMPVVDVSRLNFGVRGTELRNDAVFVQESLEYIKLGVEDPQEFRLACVKNGVRSSLDLDGDKAAYLTVVENILTIVGDGETPGPVAFVHPHMEKPELQLRVLNEFLGGPVVRRCSNKVVNLLLAYKQSLTYFMGAVLPQMVPDAADIALMEKTRDDTLRAAGPALTEGGSPDGEGQEPQVA